MVRFLLIFFMLLSIPLNSIATETTIYADQDGWVYNTNAVWATAQGAETGSVVGNTDSSAQGIAAYYLAEAYHITRSFFRVPTSTISGEIVDSAIFYLYPYAGAGTPGIISIQKGTQGDGALTTVDYDAFEGTYYDTAEHPTTTGPYITFDLNAQGVSDIDTEGYTYYCIRSYTYDYLNTPGGSFDYYSNYYSEYTGTDRDPKLVIQHHSPAISGTLKEKESDAGGSAIDYLIVNRGTGAVVASGTSEVDGTYSEEVDGAEDDVYMIDLTSFKTKCIGEQVVGE